MKYSQSTELAVDSLLYMAAHPEREVFFVQEVAQAERVSGSYLAKVFGQLAKSGLLRSNRGSKGGYSLARPAKEVTLLDIAVVFEGASPLFECHAHQRECQLEPRCLVLSTFREAEHQMHEVLRRVTLADLVAMLQANRGQAEWVGTKEKAPVATV